MWRNLGRGEGTRRGELASFKRDELAPEERGGPGELRIAVLVVFDYIRGDVGACGIRIRDMILFYCLLIVGD